MAFGDTFKPGDTVKVSPEVNPDIYPTFSGHWVTVMGSGEYLHEFMVKDTAGHPEIFKDSYLTLVKRAKG
jgi:hypothetical protein